MSIPELIVTRAPAEGEVGTHVPKPTAVTAGLTEADHEVWADAEGRAQFGVWECTPGTFTARRDGYSELCHLLSGGVTLVTDGGAEVTLTAGDAFVMPSGWVGTWHVHSPLRKLYVIIPDEPQPQG